MQRLVTACTVVLAALAVLAALVVLRPASGQDGSGTPVAGLGTVIASPAASPVASPATNTELYTIQGAITLHGADVSITHEDGSCSGTMGFEDHTVGAPVTVRDGTGAIIATGRIDQSNHPVFDPERCAFYFSVPNVPYSAAYVIQIANRPPLTYSFAQMESTGWYLRLTIGGAV